MNDIITEKDFPIQTLWLFKPLFNFFLVIGSLLIVMTITISAYLFLYKQMSYSDIQFSWLFVLFVLISIFIVIPFLNSTIRVIANFMQRSHFHFIFEENKIHIEQGIVSKNAFDIPYEAIQGVLIEQDLFERIFGLTHVTIQNASKNYPIVNIRVWPFCKNSINGHYEFFGCRNGGIFIPGIKTDQAEELQNLIMHKMKEHSTSI